MTGAIRAVRWSGISAAAVSAIALAQVLALSSLLDPSAFGLMAMANVALGLSAILADFGLGAAIIQRRDPLPEELSDLFWLALLAAGVVGALVAASAPLVALAYREPGVVGILLACAATFPLNAVYSVHQAHLEKALRFRAVAAIEIAAAGIGAFAAMAVAWRGGGAYAFVAAVVATSAVKASAYWLAARAVRIARPGFARSRSYLAFGARQVGQRFFNFISANVDYASIGRRLGSVPLGHYSLAFTLAVRPTAQLNAVIARVAFPLMSASDRERMKAQYLRMHEAAAFATLPVTAAIGAMAVPAFAAFARARWQPAAPLLEIMALLAAGRALAGTIGPLLLASGRNDLGLRWSILVAAMQAVAIPTAAMLGDATTVAWTFAALQWLYLLMTYPLLLRPVVGPCLALYAEASLRPMLVAAAAGAAAWSIGRYGLDPRLAVAAQAAVLLVVTVVGMAMLRPRLLGEFRSLLLPQAAR